MVRKINIEIGEKNWVYFGANGMIEREHRPLMSR